MHEADDITSRHLGAPRLLAPLLQRQFWRDHAPSKHPTRCANEQTAGFAAAYAAY